MKELPLAVAISALIKDNQILLIKRLKGDYVGLLGLPGGKIEKIVKNREKGYYNCILERNGDNYFLKKFK